MPHTEFACPVEDLLRGIRPEPVPECRIKPLLPGDSGSAA
jgi:hypothetical protein